MRRIRIMALCLILSLLLPFCVGCRTAHEEALCVTVIDVGQSDCVLLSLAGKHMLIDTGTGAARAAVLGELSARGVEELEFLWVTHPHEDHYGNARAVLETLPVRALLVPNGVVGDFGYSLVLQSAARMEASLLQVDDGSEFFFGEARIEAFCAIPTDAEGNNASLVLRVSFGDCVLLFTGDAEKQAEEILLSRDTTWDCDFLKVGHHGSRTACSEAFLAATTPQIAAISCGRNNDYGFPHREVLQGLDVIGAAVYRTDERGNLNFICDGKSVTYEE